MVQQGDQQPAARAMLPQNVEDAILFRHVEWHAPKRATALGATQTALPQVCVGRTLGGMSQTGLVFSLASQNWTLLQPRTSPAHSIQRRKEKSWRRRARRSRLNHDTLFLDKQHMPTEPWSRTRTSPLERCSRRGDMVGRGPGERERERVPGGPWLAHEGCGPRRCRGFAPRRELSKAALAAQSTLVHVI